MTVSTNYKQMVEQSRMYADSVFQRLEPLMESISDPNDLMSLTLGIAFVLKSSPIFEHAEGRDLIYSVLNTEEE